MGVIRIVNNDKYNDIKCNNKKEYYMEIFLDSIYLLYYTTRMEFFISKEWRKINL